MLLASVAVAARWLAPGDPFAIAGGALEPPGARHLFGTDDLGRDVFAGVVHGTATSLQVGIVAASVSAFIGMIVGGLAGARGGATDQALMRMTELVQALPRFFLIVAVVSLFGGQLALIVTVIALTTWPTTARVFRAQVMSALGREYALAARAAGSSDSAIVRRHVLPAAIGVLGAEVSYQVGGAILAEAGLSFLGLGDPSVMSWGTLLGSAQYFVRSAWWMSVFPGLAVTLAVLACNLLADTLVVNRRLPCNGGA